MSNKQNDVIQEDKQEAWLDRCARVFEYFELYDSYMDEVYETVHHDDVDNCHALAFEYFSEDTSEAELLALEKRLELLSNINIDQDQELLCIKQGDNVIKFTAWDLDKFLYLLQEGRREADFQYALANQREEYYLSHIKLYQQGTMNVEEIIKWSKRYWSD